MKKLNDLIISYLPKHNFELTKLIRRITMADNEKDTETPPEAEALTEAQQLVKQLTEQFNDKIDEFDEILAKAMEDDKLDAFIESYANLRESGFEFDDAYNTAADELDLHDDDDDED